MSYNKYSYSGPVKEFGKVITPKWTAITFAASESKARSNFMYQFKKEYQKTPSAKISLPGSIVML